MRCGAPPLIEIVHGSHILLSAQAMRSMTADLFIFLVLHFFLKFLTNMKNVTTGDKCDKCEHMTSEVEHV